MMMFKLCQAISPLILAPLISAISINIKKAEVDDGVLNLSWSSTDSDPAAFSIQLLHLEDNLLPPTFIAKGVPTSMGGLQLDLPSVPAADGYSVRFVSLDSTVERGTAYSESEKFDISAGDVTASVNSATFSLTYSASTSGSPSASSVHLIGSASLTTPASATVTQSTSGGAKAHSLVWLPVFGSLLVGWVMV